MSAAKLYQFAGSHFCEKARWALDYKGVAYAAVNLVPGPHRRTALRLAPATALPILVTGDAVIQGSVEIIDYLDKTVRQRPLTPTHTQDASMAREWERYLDRNIGVNFRRIFYYHAFRNRSYAAEFLLRGAPRWGRAYFAVGYPAIKRAMIKAMSIDAEHAERASRQLLLAADRLDERIATSAFLAGPYFSRADLTAAALLFHLWSPEWPQPAGLESIVDELAGRPFYAWARSIYEQYRCR